jgi:predicted CoA-binding protein
MTAISKKTLVLGASDNPERYSFLAIYRLRENKHPVVAFGKRTTIVEDVPVQTEISPVQDLDTVTIYLNPNNQKSYYDFVLEQHPRRVIFNPGAENPEFEQILTDHGIQVMEACTLVLLATGQF